MHYQLSEEAFNRLESARDQLRFVCDLADSQGPQSKFIASDMMAFMDAQSATLTAVLDGACFHAKTTPTPQPAAIPPDVLVQIIHVVSGSATSPQNAEDLYNMLAQMPSVSTPVFRAFVEALVRQGYDPATMKRAGGARAAQARTVQPQSVAPKRKRDRLTAGAV